MTIEFENTGVDMYYRAANTHDEWFLAMTSMKMMVGQEWDISFDGKVKAGTMKSLEVGKGGKWSRFSLPIEFGDREPIAQDIYVRGK